MTRRRVKWLLVAALAVPLLAWGYDRLMMIYWVGSADLTIEFVVTDQVTGQPVPVGRVEVKSDGGLYAEDFKQEFILEADAGGVARKECPRCMSFGTQSGLRYTDTYIVHLPEWRFRTTADGYEPGEWEFLDAPEHVRRVHRVGPGRAALTMPVALRKAHP